MRLELTGRHIRMTPGLRQRVHDALAKLDRVLHDSAVSLQAVLSQEKHRHQVELTLHARGEHFFHGAGKGRDWDTAIAQAVEKVEQQARKLKGKWTDGKRRRARAAIAAPPVPERGRGREGDDGHERAVRIIRARRTAPKPMSVDEAALEVGDNAGAFIVFRNATTDTVNVLFRRPDGNLGLIEPDA